MRWASLAVWDRMTELMQMRTMALMKSRKRGETSWLRNLKRICMLAREVLPMRA